MTIPGILWVMGFCKRFLPPSYGSPFVRQMSLRVGVVTEFAVLLPNTNLYQAKTLAERLQKSIAASSMLENDSKITCEFWVAECEPDDTKQSLFAQSR